ncbi:histidine phosphatase family protein [Pantoea vagans]|uniref:histidine phosphatase family protein n=1 Tax=Pantoea vagans TaxID=470934 RepID=UPI00320B6000
MSAVMHLICQGETLANRHTRFPANDELSEKAIAALSKMKVDIRAGSKIWLAPEVAVLQTAAALRLRGEVVTQLAEPDYGQWAGLPIKQVMKDNTAAFHRWLSCDAPPGGESIAAIISRTSEWLSRNAGVQGHHCTIASAAVICAIITGLLEAPLSAFQRIDVAPMSRTIITSTGSRWNICTLGEKI